MTKTTLAAVKLTSDVALGTVGCTLAIASAVFGGYMIAKAPAHKPDATGDFSVFAQLAPHPQEGIKPHAPSKTADDLDMEATASIPAKSPATEEIDHTGAIDAILRGITLHAAGTDDAEIAINGQVRKVRVGDAIPGAGEVLAIYPGRRPMLRTSQGLIFSDAR